ncbi:MAG: tRNA dihydrouridine synthase DusB [Gammaproteobacteria bacterium]|nr:MAG: tRNA dihydrouridine synthase DusB [Gammaproteobacteria bacterium]
MRIGSYSLANALIVAPMAGVTDRPFRRLCRQLGAGLAVSEMVASHQRLRDTPQSRRRRDHAGESEPRSVQIVGADPAQMADAARFNVDCGAQIIDINMGCPAKKVCNTQAGSALLADEFLVTRILAAVTAAVDVPVTLKIRTGVTPERRNGVAIARIAADHGIAAIAVHGRTRSCAFHGHAEYHTVAAITAAVDIPVIANGDIRTPQDARRVLLRSGADGLMIGRAAQGNPWIFREVDYFLRTGKLLAPPSVSEAGATLVEHLHALHEFYGHHLGVRIARKHLSWYCKGRPGAAAFWRSVNRVECADTQVRLVREYFEGLAQSCGTWEHAA